jgi:hypothetical protein
MRIRMVLIIFFSMLLASCSQQFERKYTENCVKMNLQTPEWCQCVAQKLDVSLTREQKDLMLNGSNNVNLSNVANAVGAVKPSMEAVNSCTEKVNSDSFAKLSPAEQCKFSKIQALKASEQFLMNLQNGARGMSVPGLQESTAAITIVRTACGIEGYSITDLLRETELTANGFVLKEISNTQPPAVTAQVPIKPNEMTESDGNGEYSKGSIISIDGYITEYKNSNTSQSSPANSTSNSSRPKTRTVVGEVWFGAGAFGVGIDNDTNFAMPADSPMVSKILSKCSQGDICEVAGELYKDTTQIVSVTSVKLVKKAKSDPK